VRFQGSRDAAALRDLLPTYHASVLLSDFEGLPVAVLESMAAGLVPVCLRVESGLPELIRHGESGLFVADREADFEAALTTLASDPERWSRLSQAARAKMEEGFSTPAVARAWAELFGQLVSSPARSTAPGPAARAVLPPPHPELLVEDVRHPGTVRAIWRWLRFGPSIARRPW
jgi:glycosyltransferase involved in cell wall biosynthesis